MTHILFILGLTILACGCVLIADEVKPSQKKGGRAAFIIGFCFMLLACGIF